MTPAIAPHIFALGLLGLSSARASISAEPDDRTAGSPGNCQG